MRGRMLFIFLVFVIGISSVARAQEKKAGDKDDVIRVDTQLVDVPIAVQSSNGTPVRGLKNIDFTLYEDGKKQQIVDFSTTSAPFEVALLLDTSGSTRSDLQLIQHAASSFIDSLRPGDRVAILAFNTDHKDNQSVAVSEVLAGLTDN